MSGTAQLYQHFAMKAFTPFLSFMIPYLVEKKGFSNRELHNNFSPFFFISSVVTSLGAFLLIELLGSRLSVFAAALVEMLVYLVFMAMPFRSRVCTTLVYVLHGATTSLGVVLKSIPVDIAADKEEKIRVSSNIKAIKTSVSVVSSWLGQDIIMCGGSHHANIALSIASLSAAAGTTLFLPAAETRMDRFVGYLANPREMARKMASVYTARIVLSSLLSTSASIMYICLSFYSASMFLEKKRSGAENDVKLSRVLFLITRPIRFISYIVIRIASVFDGSVYQPGSNKSLIVHGYVEGSAKILSSLAVLGTSWLVRSENGGLVPWALGTSMTTMLMIHLLGKAGTMTLSYVFYIMASVSSHVCQNIANMGLTNTAEYGFILSMNLFVSSIIHISITYLSRAYDLSVRAKMKAYFYVNSVFIAAALALCCSIGM